MNELIGITYENDRPTINGRELHLALEIETPYHKWFPRMCEYGFSDGKKAIGQFCPIGLTDFLVSR